jgi:hypothetical protein
MFRRLGSLLPVSRHLQQPTPEELWKRVDVALFQASSREQTLSEINRLLRKWHFHLPDDYITLHNCAIRREWLTPQQLSHFTRGHPRSAPKRVSGPLVVVEYQGETYMLDGTNRINRWLADGDREPHETVILTPQRTAAY